MPLNRFARPRLSLRAGLIASSLILLAEAACFTLVYPPGSVRTAGVEGVRQILGLGVTRSSEPKALVLVRTDEGYLPLRTRDPFSLERSFTAVLRADSALEGLWAGEIFRSSWYLTESGTKVRNDPAMYEAFMREWNSMGYQPTLPPEFARGPIDDRRISWTGVGFDALALSPVAISLLSARRRTTSTNDRSTAQAPSASASPERHAA